jgi:hypothetical protein
MVLHLRPSRDQVSSDLLRNAGSSIGVVMKGRYTGRMVEAPSE